LSQGPYDPPETEPQFSGEPPPPPVPEGPEAPRPVEVDQNPTQLGWPYSPRPAPPQFLGYGPEGQPLYGFKPGLSPAVKIGLAVAAALAVGAVARSLEPRRRRDDD